LADVLGALDEARRGAFSILDSSAALGGSEITLACLATVLVFFGTAIQNEIMGLALAELFASNFWNAKRGEYCRGSESNLACSLCGTSFFGGPLPRSPFLSRHQSSG
jgi:hypothetical protein